MNINPNPIEIKDIHWDQRKWSRSKHQKTMPHPCYASPQDKAGKMQLQRNNTNQQLSDDNAIDQNRDEPIQWKKQQQRIVSTYNHNLDPNHNINKKDKKTHPPSHNKLTRQDAVTT